MFRCRQGPSSVPTVPTEFSFGEGGKSFTLRHIENKVYAMQQSDGPTNADLYGYIFDDTARITGTPQGILAARGASGAQTLILDFRTSIGEPSKFSVFGAEFRPVGDAGDRFTLNLLSGRVTRPQLDAFAFGIPPLVRGMTLAPEEVPAAGGSRVVFKDDLAIVGGGAVGGGGGTAFVGLNFVWLNSAGQQQFISVGSNALLKERTLTAAGIDVGESNQFGTTYILAWVQAMADPRGTYDAIFATTFKCAPK